MTFVDTNVFLYAMDKTPSAKQKAARKIVAEALGPRSSYRISAQVLAEFASVAIRKLKIATPFLLDALVTIGRKDLARAVLWQNKRPSWLFEVESGATTIWESWFAMDENGKPDKISFDHYAFGVIDEFVFRRVCGISAQAPGFTRFSVAPETDWGFDFVERSFLCESGEIRVSFDREKLDVTIPCNTTATVIWNGEKHEVGSGRYTF